jgi:hypothetical protein
MLVVDGDTHSFVPSNTFINTGTNRVAYIGYVLDDEPINPINHGQGNTINPNATYVITHKIVNGITSSIHGNKNSVLCNADYIDRDTSVIISDQILFHNTPDKLMEYIDIDYGTSDYDTTAISTMQQTDSITYSPEETTHLKATLSIPSVANKQLISNIINSYDMSKQMDSEEHLPDNDFISPSIDNKRYLYENSLIDSLTLLKGTNVSAYGSAEGKILADNLLKKYDPVIMFINNNNASQLFEASDPMHSNEVNIYSSYIANALPAILSSCGLLELSFEYCSRCNDQLSMLDVTSDAWNITHYATIIPLSTEKTKAKIKMAMVQIKELLFIPVINAVGNIDATIYSFNGDDTYVKLRLLDRASSYNHIDEPYVSHTCLGGLISPQIGTSDTVYNNANELVSFNKRILDYI